MTATGRSWSRRDGRLARSGHASPPSGLGDRRDDGEWGALGPGRTLADASRRRGRRMAARRARHAAADRRDTGSWLRRYRHPKADPQSPGDLPVSVADRPPGASGPHGRGPRGSLSISSTEVLRQDAYGPQLRPGTGVGALSSSVHVAPWSPATRDAATAIAAGGARRRRLGCDRGVGRPELRVCRGTRVEGPQEGAQRGGGAEGRRLAGPDRQRRRPVERPARLSQFVL